MPDAIDAVLRAIAGQEQAALDRLFEFIRIPSNSFDPAFADECMRAAQWCTADLRSMGFEVSVRPTGGHPMVVGHRRSQRSGVPHVLFYGHYDVQPVDPLALWTTPPFEPRLMEDPVNGTVITGRGSSDDKGQLMTFIEACRAWIEAAGDLPLHVSVILEGEEECGSQSLDPFMKANLAELKADLLLVCDTGAWSRTMPAITTSLRGTAFIEVNIKGPNRDLHSGAYGNAAINPLRVLGRILGDLFDGEGRVQVPGFYDGIPEPTAAERKRWHNLGFDEKAFLGAVGLSKPAGESGRSVLEQLWARPTAEINGLYGGYQGPGGKTIIPSEGTAKFSFRLVAGQDPATVLQAFEAFVHERVPADCRVSFSEHQRSGFVGFDTDAPFMRKASVALEAEWGVAPALIGSGVTIPIVQSFKDMLGMDALMIGFAHDDDRIHSPNEKYNLESFRRGIRSWARVLQALAG